eukprot:GHVT01016156.1.p1 GENE.GHVT01016156.1~~GHVT01016156.1.p1  ORF type:complete len:372 (-),score=69.98 GHVT01016156.1:1170-2285(-)
MLLGARRVVREVETQLAADPNATKEYLPIDGLHELKELTQGLIFPEDVVRKNCIASIQTISGTGGLRVAAEFIKRFLPECPAVLLSKPTWGNHHQIFKQAGHQVIEYPYWNQSRRALDMVGLLAALEAAPGGSLVVLHACAHNPTGVDPTASDWSSILEVMARRRLFPLFDSAYQGYASGDVTADVASIRMFAQAGLELIVVQSFAKNLGLYAERVGMLHVVTHDSSLVAAVLSLLKLVVRPMYSNPPQHGALIVAAILKSPALRAAWLTELKLVAQRILSVRGKLLAALKALDTPGDWTHITAQIGMFSYTGLTGGPKSKLPHVYYSVPFIAHCAVPIIACYSYSMIGYFTLTTLFLFIKSNVCIEFATA